MKVTLIQPPALMARDNYSTITQPPLGLAYLAASARDKGHKIQVIDAVGEAISTYYRWRDNDKFVVQGLSFEEAANGVDPDTQLIGVTCMFTHAWPMVREFIRHLKTTFPDIPIIAGGEHITSMHKMVLDETPVELCVLGEGEETFLELLGIFEKDGDISSVAGIALRDGPSGSIVKTAPRARISNIDEIPWPAWDLLDPMKYRESKVYIGPTTGQTLPMLATRGCPYQCTFCSSKNMWTTRYVMRDVKDIVDEMAHLSATYGANDFQFQDLTAIIKKPWIIDFCRELIDRKLNITWQIPVGTRSEAIDREVCDLLVKSGCTYIQYAPESGSEKILASINKRVNLENLLESADSALRSGMRVCVLLIVGFPDEEKQDLKKTFKLIRRLVRMGIHEIAVSTLVPLPGTQIFEDLNKQGLIELNDAYCYWMSSATGMTQTKSWNPAFTDRQLLSIKLWGLSQFYFLSFLYHPGRMFRIFRNLATGAQETKVDRVLRELIEKVIIFRRSPKKTS